MRIYWGTFFKKHHPDKDKFPFGITFYDAPQGGGKTLSMVFDALELQKDYPDLFLISNVKINDWGENCAYFDTPDELISLLDNTPVSITKKKISPTEQSEVQARVQNRLVIIDEALTYFAENGGIDPALMNQITQNRKQKTLMFIATQKFKRTNNRLRDFSLRTVKCRHFLSFQYNVVRDDSTTHWDKDELDFVGNKLYSYIFKRNDDLYNRYDTFAITKLSKIKNMSAQQLFTPARAPAQAQDREKVKKGWI